MNRQNVEWIERIVEEQNSWRLSTLNLIASENVLSRRAREIMGSDFAHRYAEGHPGERYYQGTDKIDEVETCLREWMISIFRCAQADVRPISGTIANEAVFSRFIQHGDVVMVNSTPGGGHISHHKAGSVGKYTKNIIEFPLAPDGYHIDVDRARFLIESTRPRLIVLGKSLFLFPEPIRELAEACHRTKTLIIYDAAHVLGLVAGGAFQAPLAEGAEIVTASTHKTFFGSQRGVILGNVSEELWWKIDKGAFPGSSSNHHLDTLVTLALATCEIREFGVAYARQVIANAKALARKLAQFGFDVEAREHDFTESHQVAIDMSRFGGGAEVARTLKNNAIVLNMNLLPREPLERVTNPAGVRLGVQEMTRFGMNEPEMNRIAELFRECIIAGRNVADEVRKLRSGYQKVRYSFDDPALAELAAPAAGAMSARK